jgi:hypothetical protein
MATAVFRADTVLTFAERKFAQINDRLAKWREEQVAKVAARPKVTGPFWRIEVRHLTLAEAEIEYARLVSIVQTSEWWASLDKPSRGRGAAERLAGIAKAAIYKGEGSVTLNDDEVEFLGLDR